MSTRIQDGHGLVTKTQMRQAKTAFSAELLLGSTLELTLKKQWFDMVASGEKREEYREPSKWILSRLENKHYDTVRFRNGYNVNSPVCVCEYLGWDFGFGKRKWGGGSTQGNPIVVIKLGRVLSAPKGQAMRTGGD